MMYEYLWLVILGGAGAFFTSFGIGANDVANEFGTSVGSGALYLFQAIAIAGVFEFLGAVLMGSHVTNAVRKNIADVDCFVDDPEVLLYGMSCVIWVTGIWLLFASYWGMPVSTTHSTIGSIIGIAIAFKGRDCVVWHEEIDEFPYIKGLSAILSSWIISPVLSGIASATLYGFVNYFIMKSSNPYKYVYYFYPFLVFFTILMNSFFIIYKGSKGLELDDTPFETALAWSMGIAGGLSLFMVPTVLPYIRRIVDKKYNEPNTTETQPIWFLDNSFVNTIKSNYYVKKAHKYLMDKEEEYLTVGGERSRISTDTVVSIHENAVKHDERVEEVFKYIQVFTAMCAGFAHGANDVANSIGPFSTMYTIYVEESVEKKQDLGKDGYWILFLGGLGIVAGLSVYGYKIMSVLGKKLTKISPSRGFAIELGAVIVIILGSRFSIPLSTTHCQVGATVGVALYEGIGGINKREFAKTLFGWVLTLVFCGFCSALLFAQGIYSPCVEL